MFLNISWLSGVSNVFLFLGTKRDFDSGKIERVGEQFHAPADDSGTGAGDGTRANAETGPPISTRRRSRSSGPSEPSASTKRSDQIPELSPDRPTVLPDAERAPQAEPDLEQPQLLHRQPLHHHHLPEQRPVLSDDEQRHQAGRRVAGAETANPGGDLRVGVGERVEQRRDLFLLRLLLRKRVDGLGERPQERRELVVGAEQYQRRRGRRRGGEEEARAAAEKPQLRPGAHQEDRRTSRGREERQENGQFEESVQRTETRKAAQERDGQSDQRPAPLHSRQRQEGVGEEARQAAQAAQQQQHVDGRLAIVQQEDLGEDGQVDAARGQSEIGQRPRQLHQGRAELPEIGDAPPERQLVVDRTGQTAPPQRDGAK